MEGAILLFLGGFMGLVVFAVPLMFGLAKGEHLNKESFKDAFPRTMIVYNLYKFFPLLWIFLYLAIVPIVARFAVKQEKNVKGFQLLPRLWVVERTLLFATPFADDIPHQNKNAALFLESGVLA